MTTDIAVAQASALEAAQKMMGGLVKTVNEAPTGGGDYLKFGKDGQWSFGSDSKGVDPENDIAILNVLGIQSGFVCWTNYPPSEKKKNKKMGEQMAPVTQPIDVNSLEDHGWDWKPQQAGEFKFLEGPHEGTQVKFMTSSQGGLERFSAVVAAVTHRVAEGTPYFFPLVAFSGDHYNHPQWGKTYKPLFEIVGWADVNGNEEIEGDEQAAIEKPAAEEKAVEPEVQDEAPVEEPQPSVDQASAEPTAEEADSSDDPTPRRRRRR